MKQRLWTVSAVILALFLSSGPAFAGGWGPYFSWGQEKPTIGIDEYEGIPLDIQGDVSLDHFTFGVMYESAPARDKLFSYRGTLGFDIATNTKIEDIQLGTYSLPFPVPTFDLDTSSKYGFSTNHTFAFGIIRTDRLKWWVGPGIGFNFNYYDNVDNFFGLTLPGYEGKAGHLSVGGGAETGVNIHLGPGMTLCVGGGIHWRAFGIAVGSADIGSLFWGDGPFYFIQTSLLFRTGPDRGVAGP
jgi:hypothetical protein